MNLRPWRKPRPLIIRNGNQLPDGKQSLCTASQIHRAGYEVARNHQSATPPAQLPPSCFLQVWRNGYAAGERAVAFWANR